MIALKRTLVAFAALDLFAAGAFAQGPAGVGGPLLEPGLRQKLEMATGKTLSPVVVRSVRDAQIDYLTREDKLAAKTAEKIAAIAGMPSEDAPRPPRPGSSLTFSKSAYLQALERVSGKTFSGTERGSLETALDEHEKEQKANFDRYVRDLTSKVPRLKKSEAEEILSALAPKEGVVPMPPRPVLPLRR